MKNANGDFHTERGKDVLQIQNQQYSGTYGCEHRYRGSDTFDMSSSSYCYQGTSYTYMNNYVSATTYASDGQTLR